MRQQVSSILVNLCQLLSDIYYYPGSFGVDNVSSIVVEERRLLSYIPQCTGMEERLVNCTRNNTQCEGDGGGRVVMGCWNSSRDSSQPTLPVTTHTLAVQTSTITSTATVSTSVPSTVYHLPSRIPTSTNTSYASSSVVSVMESAKAATSDDGGQLVVYGSVAGVAGVVTVSALVLVLVVVGCTVWRNRRGHRRSDGQCLFVSRCMLQFP